MWSPETARRACRQYAQEIAELYPVSREEFLYVRGVLIASHAVCGTLEETISRVEEILGLSDFNDERQGIRKALEIIQKEQDDRAELSV